MIFCPTCGRKISEEAAACPGCGRPIRGAAPAWSAKGVRDALRLLGCALGGAIGFLMRPAAPLIGQLPFGYVVTGGISLQGMDVILRPLAERSFLYLAGGVVAGGLAGALAARSIFARNLERAPAVDSWATRLCPECKAENDADSDFCDQCRTQLS